MRQYVLSLRYLLKTLFLLTNLSFNVKVNKSLERGRNERKSIWHELGKLWRIYFQSKLHYNPKQTSANAQLAKMKKVGKANSQNKLFQTCWYGLGKLFWLAIFHSIKAWMPNKLSQVGSFQMHLFSAALYRPFQTKNKLDFLKVLLFSCLGPVCNFS